MLGPLVEGTPEEVEVAKPSPAKPEVTALAKGDGPAETNAPKPDPLGPYEAKPLAATLEDVEGPDEADAKPLCGLCPWLDVSAGETSLPLPFSLLACGCELAASSPGGREAVGEVWGG